ncbi:MAG: tetratricopeptide repeat protein [Proteobacteria bacterium]|nr:tetratricopeptide repeat protein [Pseudomonadota bacterium]
MTDVAQTLAAAMAHHRAGRLADASDLYDRVLAASPDLAEALHLSALVALQRGGLDQALARLDRAAALKPDDAVLLNDFGVVLRLNGRAQEAAAAFARTVALKADYAEGWHNLALARRALGDLPAAAAAARRALDIAPKFAAAHHALGLVLNHQDDAAGAMAAFGQAVELAPDFAEALLGLGIARRKAGRLDAAAAALRRAVALRPEWPDPQMQLALVEFHAGRLPEAIAGFRRTLELDAQNVDAGRNLLYALALAPDATPETLLAARSEFAARHAPAQAALAHANDRDPERKLKIGFLSSDLTRHPVGEMVAPLLAARDRRRFAAYVYADIVKPDAVTARCREAADSWRDISGKSDAEIAAAIRAEEVDILVMLASTFDRNRPMVAAYRPAPVQVSLFDMGSSGLDAIDYFMTDAVLHPPDTAERFTESLFRLPSLFVYESPVAMPSAAVPPVVARGHVTFGSFNNPTKVNAVVVRLWAHILGAVPGARLALKYLNNYADAAVRRRILDLFAAAGVAAARIEFLSQNEDRAAHLARYDGVDIALDPFPFTGATTTFQALSMGVPVVTLAGDRFVARMSASILAAAGLDELIAATPDDYVAKAAALAADPARLTAYRREIRPRLAASALCDSAGYARNVEAAFRAMWRRWCAQ